MRREKRRREQENESERGMNADGGGRRERRKKKRKRERDNESEWARERASQTDERSVTTRNCQTSNHSLVIVNKILQKAKRSREIGVAVSAVPFSLCPLPRPYLFSRDSGDESSGNDHHRQ